MNDNTDAFENGGSESLGMEKNDTVKDDDLPPVRDLFDITTEEELPMPETVEDDGKVHTFFVDPRQNINEGNQTADVTPPESVACDENSRTDDDMPEGDKEDIPDGDATNEEQKLYQDVYDDTLFFVNTIVDEYDFYPDIFRMIREGGFEIEIKKRYMIKAIDEMWINIVEDSLGALDTIIRNPSKFIVDNEVVMPIELSRHISSRSVKHLSQHTDYINKIEGDEITPSKILNVFHDETMLTYENKFVNTLINHLYSFVNRRYEKILREQKDEKMSSINLTSNFTKGKMKGKITFGIEISEPPEEGIEIHNHTYTKEVWRRIQRLNGIVTEYVESNFAKQMGKNFIRPPVMHTNAINKNRELRQCLALWEFIETYENLGYEMLIQETSEKTDPQYVKELYSMAALQYLIFRYKVKNEIDADKTVSMSETEKPLEPKFVTETKDYVSEDFNVFDTQYRRIVPLSSLKRKTKLSPMEIVVRDAIDIALEADRLITEELPLPVRRKPEIITEPPEPKEAFKSSKKAGRKRKKKIKQKVEAAKPLNEVEQFYFDKHFK